PRTVRRLHLTRHPGGPSAVSLHITARLGQADQNSDGHDGGEGGDKHRAKHSVTHSRLRPHLKVPSSPVAYDDGSFGHVMATGSMHHVPARSGPWGVEICQRIRPMRHLPMR